MTSWFGVPHLSLNDKRRPGPDKLVNQKGTNLWAGTRTPRVAIRESCGVFSIDKINMYIQYIHVPYIVWFDSDHAAKGIHGNSILHKLRNNIITF